MSKKSEAVVDHQAREEFLARIAEVIIDARRGVAHAPACGERQRAFGIAIEGASVAPLQVCSCDWVARIEAAIVQAVVDEVGGKTGGRFGGDALRALYAEPGYRRRIAELEAQLAGVHARAKT